MKPAGSQILAELEGCAAGMLGDADGMLEILRRGIESAGFGLISLHSHSYEPHGLTVLGIISESHVVIHTYPEAAHASVDIFTCSPEPEKSRSIVDHFVTYLAPAHVRRALIQRGDVLDVQRTDSICLSSAEGVDHRVPIEKTIYNGATAFQRVCIADSTRFGRMLVLDDDLQVAELDAERYSQVMLEMLNERSADLANVLLLGGGDGGVLKTLLEHDPASITLVEIDEGVVSLSQQYLPEHCGDAFSDSRVKLTYDDVVAFLARVSPGEYSCVVVDLSMHPEAFTQVPRETYLREMFHRISESLADGGVIVLQCCSEFDRVTNDLLEEMITAHFSDIRSKLVYLPSAFGRWRFISARKG